MADWHRMSEMQGDSNRRKQAQRAKEQTERDARHAERLRKGPLSPTAAVVVLIIGAIALILITIAFFSQRPI